MMENLTYKLTRLEGESREAKIAEFTNSILNKQFEFPGTMFHVQSTEDIEALKQYFFTDYPRKHIFGFTIPFHNLATFVPELLGEVSRELTLMCDIETETFWYSTEKFKPNKSKFFTNFGAIPSPLKNKISKITSTKKFADRVESHKKFWREIINNKSDLISLITAYVNRQHGYQIGILSSPSPLILDKEHLDFVEETYNQTKRLYHNDASINLENDGKIVGLYANFHTHFLMDSTNVTEFVKMVERAEPKALIFKIFNLEDSRTLKRSPENYDLLIKNIANISRTLNIPTFYFGTHTAGYEANIHGVDVFSEPFNRRNSNEIQFKMSSNQLQRLYTEDPLFKAGKIYDLKMGDLISRREFQTKYLNEGRIDLPLSHLPQSYTASAIKGMTDLHFRNFAKLLLIESRNYEQEQLHTSIRKSDLTSIKNKIALWKGNHIPK